MRSDNRLLIIAAASTLALTAAASRSATVYALNGLARPLDGQDALIRFDSSNPAGYTTIGTTGVNNIGFGGLDFDESGNLWAYASYFKNTGGAAAGLYKINPATGVATAQGNPGLQSLQDIAWNPVDNTMYGINSQNNVSRLYKINLNSGVVSPVGILQGLPTQQHVMSFAIDSTGSFFIHEMNSDRIYKGSTLSLSQLYQLPADTNFSQGMTIDWSNGDTGYHAAVGYGVYPHYFSRLNTFSADGSSYVEGAEFGPELPDGLPPVECGDLAIMPIPAPSTGLVLMGLAPMVMRRRR
ncbi:MAG TPA: hypothetical protein VK176_07370 [Phycisphaerales bacterium]|nr:hypothetical protein [Phycisphaerales bacterium]